MALATLSIDIEAKLANLEAGMTKAAHLAERNAEQMRRAYVGVNSAIAGIGAALGGALATAGITQLARNALDAMDALNDLKDATGASIENLSGLEQVAQRNGGTLETVSGILVKFNAALKEADGKNGVSVALKAIGLDAAALRAQDPALALQQVAVALAGFADDGNKARAVQELFGKSIRDAAPFLKDLAEAGRLNAAVTTEQAEQAERLNKQLASIQTNASNAARSLVSELAPALSTFLDRAAGIATLEQQFSGLASAILVPLEAISVFGANIAYVFKQTGNEVGGLLAQLDSMARGDFQGAANIGRMMKEDAAKARQEVDLLSARLLGLRNAGGAAASYSNEGRNYQQAQARVADIAGKSGAGKKDDSAEREFQSLMDRLAKRRAVMEREIELGRQLTEAEKLQIDVEAQLASGKSKLSAAQERNVRAEVAAIGKAEERLQLQQEELKLAKLLDAAELRRGAAEGSAVAGLLEETTSAKRAGLIDLEVLLRRSGVSGAEFEEALALIAQRMKDLEPVVEQTSEKLNAFAEQAQRNIQDAFGDTFEQAMEGKFKNIGELWLSLLKRMVAQALATDLANAVFGKTGGGSGEMWAGALSLFSKFFGVGFQGYGGRHADGGTLSAGQWGIAGEAGPEIVQGPARITPMAKVPRAGGSTVVQNFTFNGGNSRAEAMQVVQFARRAAVADMMELQRRGRAQ